MAYNPSQWIWCIVLAKINAINFLTDKIIQNNSSYEPRDQYYIKNKLLALVGDSLVSFEIEDSLSTKDCTKDLTSDPLVQSQIFDLLTPIPSEFNRKFWNLYSTDSVKATDYFHQLSIDNDYLQIDQIAKNIKFSSMTDYGELEITINMSKPEKTTKDIIANAAASKSRTYPLCQLCFENEGYLGGTNYPLRSQHRLLRLNLNHSEWGMQYSPYEYFNEHIIVISKEHRPMHISSATFTNLLDFVDLFPQYFLGSNAGIPIVGGSMLGHEHYQGGEHLFPVEKANDLYGFETAFDDVTASVINWPVSTIRLISKNREHLEELANQINDAWNQYDNEKLQIKAESDGIKHHSINPIARKKGSEYTLLIMLRDNNTSVTYPDGIFHVHPEYQHIKQENIGLIEAMGLAILPPRLKIELAEVKKYIMEEPNSIASIHLDWANSLKESYTNQNMDEFIDQNLGQVFAEILENTGVFVNHEDQFKLFTKQFNA